MKLHTELRREMSDLEADRSIAVVAAVDGQVTAIQVEAGKSITTAQPLMMLVPAGGTLVAHLMVPSHAIGFVKVGQEVRVRYSAFPYERYGIYRAEIREVSATTLGPADWAIGLPAQNEPAYRVTAILDRQAVTTDQGATHLQAGMSLAADIMLEKRSVASWLFGPIASFRQRL